MDIKLPTFVICLICTSAAVADSPVAWDVPSWVAAGTELKGKVAWSQTSERPNSIDSPKGRYTRPDGSAGVLGLTPSEAEPGTFLFTIEAGATLGTLELTLVLQDDGPPAGEPYRVAVGESVELEISGVAAETLEFPLKGWPADVVYVPCCNIYGGILQMVRFVASPVGAVEDLNGTVASDFVMALPDETVRATAGLSLRFNLPENSSPYGATAPTVLRWDGLRWGEVIGLEKHHDAVTFSCADGGLFVLARLP